MRVPWGMNTKDNKHVAVAEWFVAYESLQLVLLGDFELQV